VALDTEKEKWSNLTARDLLQMGILIYQNGVWDGHQLLSKDYIKQALSPSPQDAGYGFLWWLGEGWYACR